MRAKKTTKRAPKKAPELTEEEKLAQTIKALPKELIRALMDGMSLAVSKDRTTAPKRIEKLMMLADMEHDEAEIIINKKLNSLVEKSELIKSIGAEMGLKTRNRKSS